MKHNVKSAFKSMSNDSLRDYLTIQLALMQCARVVSQNIPNDLFVHAGNFAAQNVETAEKALQRRGLSTRLSHDLVLNAFMEGAPDLSPEVIDENPELVSVMTEEFQDQKPHLTLIEGESAGVGP